MDKKSFIVAAISVFNEEKTIVRAVLSAQKHADRVLVCDVAEAGIKGCEMAFFGRLTAAKLRYRTLHSDEYCVGVYSFYSHRNVHHILENRILMVAQ